MKSFEHWKGWPSSRSAFGVLVALWVHKPLQSRPIRVLMIGRRGCL
jgi:hypothetical protein